MPSSESIDRSGEPAQTDPARWRALLQELSDLAIADTEFTSDLTEEQIAASWLGESPATKADIAAAEKRLGVRLPPSYRAFLTVSNGWHHPNSFVVRLAGVDDIGFTRDIDPDLIMQWFAGSEAQKEEYGGPAVRMPEDHLGETLMINKPHECDDSAWFMLNPVTMYGEEMEAWFFSTWGPGAGVSPSFWHLMGNVRDNVRYMQSHRSRT